MNERPLTLAVAKGYLLKQALPLLEKSGFEFSDDLLTTRKLYAVDRSKQLRVLIIRPWDVPVYVEQGAADLGIVGKDVLDEQRSSLTRLLDLQFGQCSLVLAGPEKISTNSLNRHYVIASKYPYLTQKYFNNRGLKIRLIKLYGAIEIAPLTGLSDFISDLTATGQTLAENHLHIIDTILKSSAYLVVNPASRPFYHHEIIALVTRLKEQLN